MPLQPVQMFCAAKQTRQRSNNVDNSIKGGEQGSFPAALFMLFSFVLTTEFYLAAVCAALCAVKQSALEADEQREKEKTGPTWHHWQESAKITWSEKERSTLRPSSEDPSLKSPGAQGEADTLSLVCARTEAQTTCIHFDVRSIFTEVLQQRSQEINAFDVPKQKTHTMCPIAFVGPHKPHFTASTAREERRPSEAQCKPQQSESGWHPIRPTE